jgi:hypothetical protein
MKLTFTIILLILLVSCKTTHVQPFEKTIPGDYSQGEDGWGWQLRLYPDSTFFFQDNMCFEMYPSWQGKWTLVGRHPLLLKLDLNASDADTTVLIRTMSVEYLLLQSNKWSVQFLDAGFLKLKKNDSTDGTILKRGVLHVSYDDSKIYAMTHQSHL